MRALVYVREVGAHQLILALRGWRALTSRELARVLGNSEIEEATLGLGRHTAAWFEQAPPPDDDGEVLIGCDSR